MLSVLEQKEVVINGKLFVIEAMGATEGLEFLTKIVEGADAKLIRDTILKTVIYEGSKRDVKWFDRFFSRKYRDVQTLFDEIVEFNLGENPKDEGDTSEAV